MPNEELLKPSRRLSSNYQLTDEEKNRIAKTLPHLLRAGASDSEPIDTRGGSSTEPGEPTEDELTPEGISQAMIVAAQLGDTEGLRALRELAETMNNKGTQ